MSYYDDIFSILNLTPTKDKRAIKKAYAKKAKQYHPEENAEQWSKVHHAYQVALEYAESSIEQPAVYRSYDRPKQREKSKEHESDRTNKKATDYGNDKDNKKATDYGNDKENRKTTDYGNDKGNRKTTDYGNDKGNRKTADYVNNKTNEKTTDYENNKDDRKATDYGNDKDNRKATDYENDKDNRKTADYANNKTNEKSTDYESDNLNKQTQEAANYKSNKAPSGSYEELFGDINSGKLTEEKRRLDLYEVQTELEKFIKIKGYSTPENWRSLIESDLFFRNHKEERVMLLMKQIVEQSHQNRATSQTIAEGLSDVGELNYNHLADKYRAEIISLCRMRMGEKSGDEQNNKTRAKQKASGILWKSLAAVIIVLALAICVSEFAEVFNKSKFSEAEAATQLVTYINEKYENTPDKLQITEKDLRLHPITQYSSGERVEIGYSASISGKSVQCYVFVKQDPDNSKQLLTYFYDTVQLEKIREDLWLYIQERTGLTEGMTYLTFISRMQSDIDHSYSEIFHSTYNGDIKSFFENEKEFKEELMATFGTGATSLTTYDDGENVLEISENNPNGLCTLYFADPLIASIEDRINNAEQLSTGENGEINIATEATTDKEDVVVEVEHLSAAGSRYLPAILETLSDELHMGIECIGFPTELYHDIRVLKNESTQLNSSLGDSNYDSTNGDEVPFYPILTTTWYRTDGKMFEEKMLLPDVAELADGIYAIGISGALQSDVSALNIVEQSEPRVMKEYLADHGTYSSYSFKINTVQSVDDLEYEHINGINLPMEDLKKQYRKNCMIVIEKDKFDISSNSRVLSMEVSRENSEPEEYEYNTTLSEMLSAKYNEVIDIGNYLCMEISLNVGTSVTYTIVK